MRLMADVLREELLAVAGAYAEARGAKLSSVGQWSCGRTSYFVDLEAGRCKVVAEAYDARMRWFTDNWPDGAAWPAGVARPTPTPTRRKSA